MTPPSMSPTGETSASPSRRGRRSIPDRRQHEDSIQLPEHLRDNDSSEDETESSQGPPLYMNMNQSIFGLIAAAGTKVDFNDRFDESSSGDDDEGDGDDASGGDDDAVDNVEDLSKTTILQPPLRHQNKKESSHRRRVSGHKLLKSLPVLPKLRAKPRSAPTKLSSPPEESDEPSPLPNLRRTSSTTFPRDESNRLPPVMSRMLEARAEMSNRPSFDLENRDAAGADDDNSTPLARRLQEIFGFDEPETVIEEYPCWLLQSVLIQGFLYITAAHVCFYAYLPKKTNEVTKSGFLSKTGKRNPKYARYWFRLKGNVLSYYDSSTNRYFPHGQIDLTYGISAAITDKDKEGIHFEVVTPNRTYHFRAESAPSAKEWVRSLQRVIFRSHNDGDNVKISIPISNIMDVEEAQMVDFAHTCKIRVIDSDETYAIDEYFFAFFSLGVEPIDMLNLLVEEKSSDAPRDEDGDGPSAAQSPRDCSANAQLPEKTSGQAPAGESLISQQLKRAAKLTGQGAMRDVAEAPREGRTSGQSPGASRESSPASSSHRPEGEGLHQHGASSESFVQSSVEDPSYSNLAVSSMDDPSASQILVDSQVFHQNPSRLQRASGDGTSGYPEGDISGNNRSATPILSAYAGKPSSEIGKSGSQDIPGANLSMQQQQAQSLQSITKIGSYPLERAGALAGYLNKTQQQMRSLISTESMGYVEKVSGMWKGARKHYDEPDGLKASDDLETDTEGQLQTFTDRFRLHFALPPDEKLEATYFGNLFRVLPMYGKIYIGNRTFCFRSLIPGIGTKLILPHQDIETVHKTNGFRLGYDGLVIVIKGHEELFFEFGKAADRDDCAVTLLRSLESTRYLKESGTQRDEGDCAEAGQGGPKLVEAEAASKGELPGYDGLVPPHMATGMTGVPPTLDDASESLLNFKPKHSMKITCLTIGSRGDVQPYIALCKGLKAEGHQARIATHAEFQGWVESYGIEFARVEGDPADLMRLCIEHGTFTWAFLREANTSFRGWLDGLLVSAAKACEGSDLLIESPSAMAGIHIAEKLRIPYFRAFTMPWTRTRAYSHAFVMPETKMGGAYNYMTYIMFDGVFWKAIAHQVNRWRNKTLGLPNTSLEKMQPNKVPFLYNFSPNVVVPPLDYSDWIRVTGYWFLDEGDRYEPPKELEEFIRKAREDGKKIVYVGFGSIIVEDPPKMTREVIDAVLKADVRCILSKGWSERISTTGDKRPAAPSHDEPEMPPEIHVIKSAPHDWLFSRIDAAAHHGGSGTTGASLRAGIPTIVRPFFGDQYFFASRVEDLGVGVYMRKWGTNSFGRALWEVTRNDRMIVKARALGEQIREENGVERAIQCIYRDLEYAKRLILLKAGKSADPDRHDDDDAEEEESWTFVGADEPDPDLITPKLSDALGAAGGGEAGGSRSLKGQGQKGAQLAPEL